MKDKKEAEGRRQKAEVKNNWRGTNACRDRFVTCLIVNKMWNFFKLTADC